MDDDNPKETVERKVYGTIENHLVWDLVDVRKLVANFVVCDSSEIDLVDQAKETFDPIYQKR